MKHLSVRFVVESKEQNKLLMKIVGLNGERQHDLFGTRLVKLICLAPFWLHAVNVMYCTDHILRTKKEIVKERADRVSFAMSKVVFVKGSDTTKSCLQLSLLLSLFVSTCFPVIKRTFSLQPDNIYAESKRRQDIQASSLYSCQPKLLSDWYLKDSWVTVKDEAKITEKISLKDCG